MALELVAHRCDLCKKAFKSRKAAKEHVSYWHKGDSRIGRNRPPGCYVSYIWIDLTWWRPSREQH